MSEAGLWQLLGVLALGVWVSRLPGKSCRVLERHVEPAWVRRKSWTFLPLMRHPIKETQLTRDAAIRCLIHFLGESTEELIKDYQQDVSKDVIEQDIKDSVIKILVLGNAAEGAPPTDVIIVIDVLKLLWKTSLSGDLMTDDPVSPK
ncbi:hypothetical protein MHYP_G00090960 [Metynnis hypsauchen]